MMAAESRSFPFPFVPYEIQTEFMSRLYDTLENSRIGIFESPTGTGKSLSLICGSLKWLLDHNEKEKERVEAILAGNVTAAEGLLPVQSTTVQESSNVPDWFLEYDKNKAIKDEAYRLKRIAERKKKREERVKRMKDQYGHSLIATIKRKDNLSEDIPLDSEQTNDDDIVVDEYHSDDEYQQSAADSESSDCDSEIDEPVLKIFYASRTHSQLTQFIHEIQKTPYKDLVTVVPLGSRLTYCVNERVKRLKSLTFINDRCLELKRNKSKAAVNQGSGRGQELKKKRRKPTDSGGCPFNKATKLEVLRDLTLGAVQDIEQLVSTGKQLGACPYYATRHAVTDAQLVVMPYSSLLHAGTRESLGVNIKGSVVIIDEAHNLLDTISSIHSVCVTTNNLKKCHSQLEQYRDKYRSRLKAKNLLYINQLINIHDQFLSLFSTDLCPAKGKSDEELTVVLKLNEFLMKSCIDNINMFKILRYCKKSEISKKLNGFAQRYLDGTTDDISKSEATPNSPLLIIEQFLESLTGRDKDCRIVIKSAPGLISHSSIRYLLLNPSVHFTSIIKEARSVVVAGGTMEPISEFKDQLFSAAGVTDDRIEHFSCGHVIEKDNLICVSLPKGPSGIEFDFTFQKRNDLTMIDELGRTVANLCTIVPGGVVCFFPSYSYECKVYDRWAETGQLQKINKRKQVFREPKLASQVEHVLTQYGRCIEFNSNSGIGDLTGAIMLCVVGGKLSEGINFSDDLGRCVIMIGLPFPNIKSPELVEKMDYLNKTQSSTSVGKLPGQRHYENLCMKAVNQSIGRAIRHLNDYASIMLIDGRYSSPMIHTKLPQWISQQLLLSSSFGHMFGTVRKFFLSKKKTSLTS